AAREAQLVRDTAAVMRLLETALVLNNEETCPGCRAEEAAGEE
ncbi:hypothetical protein A2U01_0091174, partial [Trifolium medium]|nr:hypothetical protein [Trifolium medium]